jgi:hypothetical protein
MPKVVFIETELEARISQTWTQTQLVEMATDLLVNDSVKYTTGYQMKPKLKIGLDLGVTSLTLSWKPMITFAENNADYVNSTNLLNLANWDIAFVLYFDPKDL